ncbi:M28 family peptidase [Acaryochloris thomasi]|nr:M28 family peptidase [Acaryochloris thomasi]
MRRAKWVRWGQVLGLFAIALSLTLIACNSIAPPTDPIPTAAPASPAPIPEPTASAQPPAPQVSIERLMGHMEALNHERFTEDDRRRTRDYASEVLQAEGWVISEQTFDTGVNLVAQRPDADPSAEKILVAAHYDSVRGSPGADDNASGVAAALEVASILGNRPTNRTLQIVLFDQEEAQLVGSSAYVEEARNLENVAGVVVLEMLGYACYTEGCQQQPAGLSIATPSKVGDFLAVVGDTEHRPLLEAFERTDANLPTTLTLPVPAKGLLSPMLLLSDHTPFWFKNVGAVMVTDTAFLRNPHYHRSSDTPDTFDRDFFQGVTQIVANATSGLLAGQTPLLTPRP